MRLTGKQIKRTILRETRVGRESVLEDEEEEEGDAEGARRKRKRMGRGKDEERGPIHDCALVNGLNGRSRERERRREDGQFKSPPIPRGSIRFSGIILKPTYRRRFRLPLSSSLSFSLPLPSSCLVVTVEFDA